MQLVFIWGQNYTKLHSKPLVSVRIPLGAALNPEPFFFNHFPYKPHIVLLHLHMLSVVCHLPCRLDRINETDATIREKVRYTAFSPFFPAFCYYTTTVNAPASVACPSALKTYFFTKSVKRINDKICGEVHLQIIVLF